jgi:hypothetical protein
MYVVRDIFHLKFGHYRDVKALMDEGKKMNLFPETNMRMLTDFTGDAYRLILEQTHDSLAAYEQFMSDGGNQEDWQKWYSKFKEHVVSSHREIRKLVAM